MRKKLLIILMILSLPTISYAIDITTVGSDSEIPVELTQAASAFSVKTYLTYIIQGRRAMDCYK